ncbi:MAG: transcriptional regulator, LacI family [Microbacteriaceae bacterium]|jgi:LacI family transcriptional regulator|nr:transcriptional regulator, LacI family [Microbacteriaceae bacterium]
MSTTEETPRRPTMTDVAELAGVSLKTVSRVVNEVDTVNPELAAKVNEAAAALGFRRNQIAASLRTGKLQPTIAFVITDTVSDSFSGFGTGVAQVAGDHGAYLITATSPEDVDAEREIILNLCGRSVDGMIVVPAAGNHAPLRGEIQRGIPMVFIDRVPAGLSADSVVLDNLGGTFSAARLLIKEGHRRIGVIVDTLRMPTMRERLEGVETALEEAGIILDHTLVRTDIREQDDARRATDSLLDADDPPTAFICGHALITLGVAEAVWNRGDHEPIIGFGDFGAARMLPNAIRVIGYDPAALGRLAAELLFRRINGDTSPWQTLVLPTTIRDRGLAMTPRRTDSQ